MRMVDLDRLKTVRHYAEDHGIVKETVMSRIRKGRIESVRIDGRIFIVEPEEKENSHEDKC